MIIGGNNQNNFRSDNQNFQNKWNTIQQENKKNNINPFIQVDHTKQYNVTSKNEMADKSLAMLQDRLNNGLISLDEFNKKCEQLNRLRNNQ